MSYLSKRQEFKSGDLFATTHKSWKTFYDLLVQGVRIGTQSEYAHVGILWCIGGRVFVVESVSPYVRITPLSKFADEGFDPKAFTERLRVDGDLGVYVAV